MVTPQLPTHPRYRVIEVLGEGGMGVVYKALDRDENRTVALKTLRARNVDERRSLEREIRALSRLRHPSIVRLHDVGTLDSALFRTPDMSYWSSSTVTVRP